MLPDRNRRAWSEDRAKGRRAGVTPKEFVDNDCRRRSRRIWDLMNASYDNFIRTTDEDHEKQVQKIFKRLYDQGDIYKGYYEGMYCTPCESFLTAVSAGRRQMPGLRS